MTEVTRRAALGGFLALTITPGFAEAWPDRSITLLIGFPAGGPTDVVGRIVAQALSQRLGQSMVVENRPGAAGSTAGAQIARAVPDGYTLLMMTSSYAASAALFRSLPYRPVDDFSLISTIIEFPYVIATYADHPVKTVADLVNTARSPSQKGPLTFGTSGVGSTQHLAVEQFEKLADIHLQHVPFRGGAPAITELLGKRIDFVADQPSALVDLIRGGQFRAVAVTGAKRFFSLPDVPTIAESGFPGYAVTGWQGLVGPANLPAPIVNKLHAELAHVIADAAIVEQFRKFGNEPKPSTPEAFRTRLSSEIETWTTVVAAANIERI
jgi:tripartite-type tricarboxylate transporter receptor subunit TctC